LYSGVKRTTNGVGILVKRDLVEQVAEVRRKSNRIMSIKLVVGSEVLNVVSVYAPQRALSEKIKRLFWEDLDEVVQGIPQNEGLLIGVTLMDISVVEGKVMRLCMEAWATV